MPGDRPQANRLVCSACPFAFPPVNFLRRFQQGMTSTLHDLKTLAIYNPVQIRVTLRLVKRKFDIDKEKNKDKTILTFQ